MVFFRRSVCRHTANAVSVLLLLRYRDDGDANVRSVWHCSRNDTIDKVIVLIAALAVWDCATAWPDLLVAGIWRGSFSVPPY